MTPRSRSVLRHLAHHGPKDTAARFRISERQVNRILNAAKDRLGTASEYEVFRWAEKRERVAECETVEMWR